MGFRWNGNAGNGVTSWCDAIMCNAVMQRYTANTDKCWHAVRHDEINLSGPVHVYQLQHIRASRQTCVTSLDLVNIRPGANAANEDLATGKLRGITAMLAATPSSSQHR